VRRVVAALRREGGHTLIELVVVMSILSIVLGGITVLFVQSSNAELGLNLRFQAQNGATVALRRLRDDVHCASSITPAGTSSSIALTLPAQCPDGGGTVSWCTGGSGSRFGLYRAVGGACSASATQWADYLTSAMPFTFTAQVSGTSLGKLHVDLPVNVRPTRPTLAYRLVDDIVLRNSTRT
jgi:prepilin-type N-terminal cleavage/methylation domain-containing protein